MTIVDSRLYGTTLSGGANDLGTAYSMNLDGSDFRLLRSFSPQDGTAPAGPLSAIGSRLYGTTVEGGTSGFGTVFSMERDGSDYRTLYSFQNIFWGGHPNGRLEVVGTTLYGTALRAGSYGNGTVFSIEADGSDLQLLHLFGSDVNVPDGYQPRQGVTIAGPRVFGTTFAGPYSTGSSGTVYSMNLDGSDYRLLHEFDSVRRAEGFDVSTDLLVVGSRIFGANSNGGGPQNDGVLFSMNLDGTDFQVLLQDSDVDSELLTDGSLLYWGNEKGISAMNLDGTGFQTIIDFDGLNVYPTGDLVLNGNYLYGVSAYGGAGAIYRVAIPEASTITMLTAVVFGTLLIRTGRQLLP